MRYRIHPKTGDKVSEIGFGTAYFYEVGMEEGIRILRRAFEGGINYFDLATSDIATFVILREALHDVRKDILLQVHFGADYSCDAYGWTLDLEDASGKCVYCNHCKPCPVGLDIGLINKYYDLAKAGDVLAVEHYKTLEKNAADCIGCGHCDSRCPFKVEQSDRMKEIRAYMESI